MLFSFTTFAVPTFFYLTSCSSLHLLLYSVCFSPSFSVHPCLTPFFNIRRILLPCPSFFFSFFPCTFLVSFHFPFIFCQSSSIFILPSLFSSFLYFTSLNFLFYGNRFPSFFYLFTFHTLSLLSPHPYLSNTLPRFFFNSPIFLFLVFSYSLVSAPSFPTLLPNLLSSKTFFFQALLSFLPLLLPLFLPSLLLYPSSQFPIP